MGRPPLQRLLAGQPLVLRRAAGRGVPRARIPPGFAPWRRGAYLPPSYQGFVVDEYWRYHLRRPPFGYHWVQVGDDFLLVSVSSGVIFDIIAGE